MDDGAMAAAAAEAVAAADSFCLSAATSLATESGDFALLQPEAAAITSSATNESVSFCIIVPHLNYSTI